MATSTSGVQPRFIAEAELDILRALATFVREGLRDIVGQPTSVTIDVVELVAYQKRADFALNRYGIPSRTQPKRTETALAVARDHAWDTYTKNFKDLAARHSLLVAVPGLDIKADSGKRDGVVKAPAQALFAVNPVQFAYEMAKFNRFVAEQRIVALYVLAEMTRTPFRDTRMEPAIEQSVQAASAELWANRGRQQDAQFAMGLLLGGAAQQECVDEIKQSYRPGYSVMQLVTRGGYLPGRVYTEEEDALRAAIANAQPGGVSAAIKEPVLSRAAKKKQ